MNVCVRACMRVCVSVYLCDSVCVCVCVCGVNVCVKWFTPNHIGFLIRCLCTLVSFMS